MGEKHSLQNKLFEVEKQRGCNVFEGPAFMSPASGAWSLCRPFADLKWFKHLSFLTNWLPKFRNKDFGTFCNRWALSGVAYDSKLYWGESDQIKKFLLSLVLFFCVNACGGKNNHEDKITFLFWKLKDVQAIILICCCWFLFYFFSLFHVLVNIATF